MNFSSIYRYILSDKNEIFQKFISLQIMRHEWVPFKITNKDEIESKVISENLKIISKIIFFEKLQHNYSLWWKYLRHKILDGIVRTSILSFGKNIEMKSKNTGKLLKFSKYSFFCNWYILVEGIHLAQIFLCYLLIFPKRFFWSLGHYWFSKNWEISGIFVLSGHIINLSSLKFKNCLVQELIKKTKLI